MATLASAQRHRRAAGAGLDRGQPAGVDAAEHDQDQGQNRQGFAENLGAAEGAVVVASSYTKVGGLYDRGFRHDPERPIDTLGEYCMGCYTNLSFPQRVQLLEEYIRDYEADGFLINSVKSCNSFSAGQLMILREVEKRSGLPGGFIESDLVDPRYFSAANIKNRLESYFQMIDAKRERS